MKYARLLKRWILKKKFKAQSVWWRIKYTLFRHKMPQNADGKIYLNLGCGVNTSSEFVNIDAVPFAHTHMVANIQDLSMFPTGTVDMIYASHVIEHIPRSNLERTIREWYRVLKKGGVLRFGVPNFDALVAVYQASNNDVDSIVNQLLGQDGEYDDHHTIWNTAYAEKVLRTAGFTDVRPWDPEAADHHSFKDKTNRVMLVHDQSFPISLNLEAIK